MTIFCRDIFQQQLLTKHTIILKKVFEKHASLHQGLVLNIFTYMIDSVAYKPERL
jgi:hypothetical protein